MRLSYAWLPVVALFTLTACPPAAKTERIELTPGALALQVDEARTVAGRLIVVEDGTVGPVTGATWSSSDEAVATVAVNTDGTATVTGVGAGSATITVSLRSVTATVSVLVSAKPRNLLRIEVTPAAPSLALGTSLQLTATGLYTDDSRADLTSAVTWRSSAESVLAVSPGGLVTGLSTGNATISAFVGDSIGNVSVTVTAATLARIEVTPPMPTLARGFTVSLTATGIFTDDSRQDLSSQVTWASANTAVATVSSAGLVTGVTGGTAAIRATRGTITGETTVTVSSAELLAIDVTPAAPSLPRGATVQLTATARFSDNTSQDVTTQATWSSSSSGVVSVSNDPGSEGLATARAQGAADLIATLASKEGRTTVTVTAATLSRIDVTPAMPTLVKGLTRALTATGVYSDGATADLTSVVTWSSSDPSVASVSNAQGSYGLARGLGTGPTTITATRGAVSGTTTLTVTAAEVVSIAVTPASGSVALGLTRDFVATGTFTDGTTQDITTQVTWSVTNTTAASISNAAGTQGRLTPLAVGSTTVRATSGTIVGSATATIIAAQLVSIDVTPASPTIAKGATQALVATGRYTDNSTQVLTSTATWSSGTTTVATVTTSGTRGVVTAVAAGTSVITATSGTISGTTTVTVTPAALVSLAVTPANPSVAKGLAQAFVATGTYSDTTTAVVTDQVTWSSGTTATATISNAAGTQGVATTLAVGTSVITATLGSVSGTTTLTVTAPALVSIALSGVASSLRRGDTGQYIATGTYTDGSTAAVTATATWASGTPATASISDATGTKGLVTALAVGTTNISATVGTVTGSTSLTVTPPDLVSIAVTPATQSLAVGQSQAFVATGTYSDTTTAVITASATWSSSASTVASVSDAAGTKGQAQALAQGSATITAAVGSISGSASLSVTALALSSLAVTPATPSVVEGLGQAFVATATYTDNSTAIVTDSVTWTSSTPATATISDAAGTKGQATAVAPGTTTITATLGTVSGTATMTVTAKVLTSIAVTPATPSVAKGRTQAFTATATYNNSTTGDVTSSVTWSSSNGNVTIVSTTGVATAAAEGSSTITATSGSVSGTATMTVTAAELVSIAITGLPATFRKGDTANLVATGTYTDATQGAVTTTATWASTASGVASVSDTAGTKGALTGVTAGSASITATVGTIVGTLAVTVAPPDLVSIAVTPASPSINNGATVQLAATGTYSDSSTATLTGSATWASATTTVATVSAGGLVTGVSAGTSVVSATVGTISGSQTVTVVNPPPAVTAATPADAATNVSTLANVVVTFDRAMDTTSLTVQSAAGACTGSIQLSRDDFATCLGLGTLVFNGTNTVATATPVPAMADSTTYKLRVTTAAKSALGVALTTAFTQATGFTTRGGARCGTSLVISQVYGGGGNTGAQYTHDFVELRNPTAAPIVVTGWGVQYASSTGTTWAVTPLPAATIPAGGYFLVQMAAGAGNGVALPTPDATGTSTMSGTAGKVALTNTTTALTGAAPTSAAIVDFVGYGSAANFSETAPTATLSNTLAAIRRNAGCGDANNNATDFDALAPTPRNSATTAALCACSLNEVGAGEADFCNLQSPSTLAAAVSAATSTVYGRIYEATVTEPAGAPAGVQAQFGFGPTTANPQSQSGWTWFSGAYNVQVGNDDEFQYVFTAPATPGTFSYGVRFSFDGLNWTYCDLDGAGANTGLSFDPAKLGVLTVSP